APRDLPGQPPRRRRPPCGSRRPGVLLLPHRLERHGSPPGCGSLRSALLGSGLGPNPRRVNRRHPRVGRHASCVPLTPGPSRTEPHQGRGEKDETRNTQHASRMTHDADLRRNHPVPELPEVEAARRGIAEQLLGRVLVGYELTRPALVVPAPGLTLDALVGSRLECVERHGKYLFLSFEPAVLVIHLKLAGQLVARGSGIPGFAAGHPVPAYDAPLPHKST